MSAIRYIIGALALGLTVLSCEPSQDSKTPLGDLPTADFDYTFIDSNTILFESISTGDPFIYQWDIEGVGTYEGETAEIFISKMGTYNVTHNVFNQGGHASADETIEILRDAPQPCTGLAEFLTDCGSRDWKIAEQAGALWVGPADASQTWWAIPATGPTDRPCLFNDVWTFSDGGVMDYDTDGDVWCETYMGVSADGCFPESQLSGNLAPWQSGTHAFEVIPGAGVDGTDQIKVSGLGAFIGLPKASNGAEVTAPVSSVTYDVLSADTVGTDRYMEIEVNFGPGVWRFTLYSE